MNPSEKKTSNTTQKRLPILWTLLPVLFLGLLFARAALPENLVLQGALGFALVADLVAIGMSYRAQIRARTLSYGANWAITLLLTFAIVAVVNFFAFKNPKKFDVTKGKVNTLSEQTVKILKEIKEPVKFIYFARTEDHEQNRPFFENLRAVNPKIEIEKIDALKGALQAQALGVRTENVLIIRIGDREGRVETLINEEKVTNALIRLVQGKAPVLCAITNHGEKDFNSTQPDGYQMMRKILEQQNYQIEAVDLISAGKIPETCAAVALVGPKSAFMETEVKTLRDYFTNGGRAIVTLDLNISGAEPAPQLMTLLREFGVESPHALILDPNLQRRDYPPDVAPIRHLNDHPIVDDLKKVGQGFYSAATRPLKAITPAPEGLKIDWLAQTTPSSYAKTNFSSLAKGDVRFASGDIRGPHYIGIAVSGKMKESKAKNESRLVVLGSTMFAANAFTNLGKNMDFFANSVRWILEDENLISIRPKVEESGRLELSETAARLIGLVTLFVVPFLVLITGVVVWVRRRKL